MTGKYFPQLCCVWSFHGNLSNGASSVELFVLPAFIVFYFVESFRGRACNFKGAGRVPAYGTEPEFGVTSLPPTIHAERRLLPVSVAQSFWADCVPVPF